MSYKDEEDFKDFSGLAGRLKRADFSGESRVRDTLKGSLLDRAERRGRRRPFVWLLPVAALAAVLLMVNVRQKPLAAPAPAASYNLTADGYGECGRQGLGDYMAEGRY